MGLREIYEKQEKDMSEWMLERKNIQLQLGCVVQEVIERLWAGVPPGSSAFEDADVQRGPKVTGWRTTISRN